MGAQAPALARIPFWYLRHGETDWNARNLSQGNTDVALNANGIVQARTAAQLLVGRGIASIVASPLSRARDTAAIVGEVLALPVAIEEGLREVAFGTQEGEPMGDWFADWIAGAATPEGAESFAGLRDRATVAVNRATTCPPSVLVVAHGALFRALRSAMGLEPNQRTRNGVPFWCAPGRVGSSWVLTPAQEGAALNF